MTELHQEQKELINKIRKSFASGAKFPCVQASTGFGKSVVSGYIIKSALDKGSRRVVLIVDSLTLIGQLLNTFETMFGLDCGVIQGINDRTDLRKPVQIATPQTLARRFESASTANTFRDYIVDFIVVDECHVNHEAIKQAKEYWGCRGMGVTATPFSKGMGLVYDDLVKADTLDVLIERGYLAPYRAFSHETPDFKGCKVGANGDIMGAANKYDDGLVADVFKTWNKDWSDRLTIGFAPTIAKCEAFANLFREHGVRSEAIHSKLNDEDAAEMIERFRSRDIQVLWSVAKLVKGFDVAEASCMIDCQPTHSLIRHVQKIGRVLRKHKDKQYAVILDHAGNMIRCGLPEDAQVDRLSIKEKNEPDASDRRDESDPKPVECPHCKYVIGAYKPGCPNCGGEVTKKSRTDNPDEISWEDGQLVEIGGKAKYNKWQKQEIYSGLLEAYKNINASRINNGKQPMKKGWIANQYKDMTGVWPKGLDNAPAPSFMVDNWLKSQRIRYAKGRRS